MSAVHHAGRDEIQGNPTFSDGLDACFRKTKIFTLNIVEVGLYGVG